MSKKKIIHCANCLNCKTFLRKDSDGKKGERRVRCKAGQWTSPGGKEKTFSLHTVLARQMLSCPDYDSMGDDDEREFLKDLLQTLPAKKTYMVFRQDGAAQ